MSDFEFHQELDDLLEAVLDNDKKEIVSHAAHCGYRLAQARTAAAHAKLNKELAIASYYGQGKVVGGNKEARDACAEGLVGAESRALIDMEAAVLLLAAQFEAIRFAKQLLVGEIHNGD